MSCGIFGFNLKVVEGFLMWWTTAPFTVGKTCDWWSLLIVAINQCFFKVKPIKFLISHITSLLLNIISI